jgi:hypothetical protein
MLVTSSLDSDFPDGDREVRSVWVHLQTQKTCYGFHFEQPYVLLVDEASGALGEFVWIGIFRTTHFHDPKTTFEHPKNTLKQFILDISATTGNPQGTRVPDYSTLSLNHRIFETPSS